MRFKEGHPIIIGLSGEAGTGKTVSATAIVPEGVVTRTDLYWWDHKFLAMPLYAIANARRDISGQKADERMKFEIHSILFDLFGKSPLYGLPDYDLLYELVYDIMHTPIEMDRSKKPRSFLQDIGSLCREIDKDCFAKWMIRSIKRDAAWAEENDKQYICYVSDIRMPNEAEGISKEPNGIVIRLSASENIRRERLLNRDGYLMTQEQSNHESEQVNNIPKEFITHTLDTDNMTVTEQAQAIVRTSSQLLGIELQTKVSPGEYIDA